MWCNDDLEVEFCLKFVEMYYFLMIFILISF